MTNDAQVFLAGYVATDPVYWQNRDGNSKATLRVAYTPRYLDRSTGEWTDSPTSFVTVICWRKLADNVALCLRKGEPVLVRGRLQVRRWDDQQGRPHINVDVDAQSIGHDLARGVALFQRTRRVARDTVPDAAAPGAEGAAGPGSAAGTQGVAGAEGLAGAAAPGAGSGHLASGGRPAPGGRDQDGAGQDGPEQDDPDRDDPDRDGPGRDDLDRGDLDEADDVLDDGAVAALLQGGGGPLGEDGTDDR